MEDPREPGPVVLFATGRTAETKLEGIDFDGHVGDRLDSWWFGGVWEILRRLGFRDGKTGNVAGGLLAVPVGGK